MYTRRLKLEGMHNTRDLGGYPVDGGRTKFGVFLRSEKTSGLSENDTKTLRDYGVTMCLDFRSTPEMATSRSDFENYDWVEYRHMPTYTPDGFQTVFGGDRYFINDMSRGDYPWVFGYKHILDGAHEWFKACIEAAAECEGVLQFHCSSGKDRTGVFSAMLLSLAGVEKWDIVADYCVSECLLDRVYMKTRKNYDPTNRESYKTDKFIQTDPINMFGFMEHLEEKYGGAYKYLIETCGVAPETIEKIRAKFIEKE